MSFFANLVAGLGTGLGKGLVTEADYQDKLDAQKALLAERQADKLESQQRDHAMRLELAALKAPGGGGSGGGSDLFNLALLAQQGKLNPDQLEAATRMFSGEAADQMRYVLRGGKTGLLPDQAPTEQDVLAAMQYTGAPQPPPDKQLGSADRIRGEQALQRIYTLLRDPAKLDDMAKGERGFIQNDLGVAGVVAAGKAGKSAEEVGNAFNRVANPAPYDMDGSAKTQRTSDAAKATEKKAELDADKAEKNRISQEIRALERELSTTYKPEIGEADGGAARLERRKYLEAEIAALRGSRTAQPAAPVAPAKPTISKDGRTATGTITRPRDAARAAGY